VEIAEQYANLSEESISQVKVFTSLFLNEGKRSEQEAYYGFVTDIKVRDNGINIYFKKLAVIPQGSLIKNHIALAIDPMEFSRTHWTIKNINLHEELADAGIVISEAVQSVFNINEHIFDIAMTFSGDNRPLVKSIVEELSVRIAANRIFYYEYYQAYLARPSLDTLLQDIYRNRSKLFVVFLCKSYQNKEWCGLEFHAIRDIIKKEKTIKSCTSF